MLLFGVDFVYVLGVDFVYVLRGGFCLFQGWILFMFKGLDFVCLRGGF